MTLGSIVITMGTSPATPSTIGMLPFPDTMRIALGSVAAAAGMSTAVTSSIVPFPSSNNANFARLYIGYYATIYFNAFCYGSVSVKKQIALEPIVTTPGSPSTIYPIILFP